MVSNVFGMDGLRDQFPVVQKQQKQGSSVFGGKFMDIKATLVAIALAALAGCTQAPAQAPVGSAAPSAASAAPPARVGSEWMYGVIKDPMTDAKVLYADVTSTNAVNFGFPYSGVQHATLQLFADPRSHGLRAMLHIEKGQLLCAPQACVVRVRFDGSPVIDYPGQSPSDGDSTMLIIEDAPTSFETTDRMNEYASDDSFSGLLLKAKRIRISAEVYQEGSPTFVFDVRGLNQDKSGLTCLSKAAYASLTTISSSKHLPYKEQLQAEDALYSKVNQECIEQQEQRGKQASESKKGVGDNF